jgi:flavin-binding protein dodecin
MTASVAKVTELTAKSDKSFEDAIQTALKRAGKTIRNITSAWVKEQRVEVSQGRISAYQVNLLVTFVLDE